MLVEVLGELTLWATSPGEIGLLLKGLLRGSIGCTEVEACDALSISIGKGSDRMGAVHTMGIPCDLREGR